MANNSKNNVSGGFAALIAAVAGVAAGAAAVFLSDKGNRDKVKDKYDETVKDHEKELKGLQQKAQVVQEEGRKKLIEGLDQAKKKLTESKKTT